MSVVMTIFTVIASVTATSGTEQSIFNSVWVVFILAAFVVIQVICLFTVKRKFDLYKVGFYIFHVGIVLLLCGCFIYYIAGDVINVSVPVDSSAVYSEIKREGPDKNGNDILKLDFGLGVSDFRVERYEASEDAAESDKYYETTLLIMPEGTRNIERVSLSVNNPHRESGWKIYLMNYDRITESSVQLMLKNDPGEYISLAGIWMMIGGTVIMCLLKKRKAGDIE